MLGEGIVSRGHNPYCGVERRIFEGVLEEIAQHLAYELAVGLDNEPFSNLQRDGVILPLQRLKRYF